MGLSRRKVENKVSDLRIEENVGTRGRSHPEPWEWICLLGWLTGRAKATQFLRKLAYKG